QGYHSIEKIKSLQSMNKILNSKLALAQKDAFSTQKEIIKKESKIISLKSELTNIKNELMNTKDKLASKIKKIEYLDALCSVLQKTKDILDPVESKTYCSAIVMRGEKKNMQSEEQSFILNSRDTSESRPEWSLLCRLFKGDSLSHKSLAKYFKSKTLPIITNNQNSELLIQDITNKQNLESLIQDITIKETVCTGEALVNDKNIFHPLPPSCSLNSKPNYSHRMTISDNLFSEIYSQSEGTNVPKLTMNEQSKEAVLQVPNSSDIQKNQKKELLQNKPKGQTKDYGSSSLFSKKMIMSWPFSKVVSGKSGTGKTNILENIFVDNKDECIYIKKKGGSHYIRCDDLIVCGYHLNKSKWAFVRYMYRVIASDPRAPYYENIRFKYISSKKISSVKLFSSERIIIRENLSHLVIFNSGSSSQDVSKIVGRYTDDIKSASIVINSYLRKSEFIVFDLNRAEDDLLAIRLRFDTPLDLQKEIELCQKRKTKNALLMKLTNSEPEKSAT
ncbi:10028_t:CDS:2, partial [Cetraspora pellucida]